MAAGDQFLIDSDLTDNILLDSDLTDVLLIEAESALNINRISALHFLKLWQPTVIPPGS